MFDPDTARKIRNAVRNTLLPSTPLRVARILVDKASPKPVRDRLPFALQRKPLQIALDSPVLQKGVLHQAIDTVNGINRGLYTLPAISERYGISAHEITDAVFGRTAKRGQFPTHQDFIGIHGIGYAIQTATTLWSAQSIEAGGYAGIGEIFSTEPGDVVVIAQRAREWEPGELVVEEEQRFYEDGSVIHTGWNMSDEVRYGLNLFSREFQDMNQYKSIPPVPLDIAV